MPIKLLFVDDEPAFEKAIKQQFRKEILSEEYEIIFARTGEEALEIIEADREGEIRLLITDIMMPEAKIDGFQLLRALHQKRLGLRTFIISAYADTDNYRRAIEEDVLLFLTKPCEAVELKILIETALNKPEVIFKKLSKVRIETLTKLVNGLTSQQKENLIHHLIGSMKQQELVRLEREIPQKMREQIESNERMNREKEEMVNKLRSGEIDPNLPFSLLEGHYIEEKYIRRDGKSFGPYYYLRWRAEGKLQTKYLGRKDPRKDIKKTEAPLPPEE